MDQGLLLCSVGSPGRDRTGIERRERQPPANRVGTGSSRKPGAGLGTLERTDQRRTPPKAAPTAPDDWLVQPIRLAPVDLDSPECSVLTATRPASKHSGTRRRLRPPPLPTRAPGAPRRTDTRKGHPRSKCRRAAPFDVWRSPQTPPNSCPPPPYPFGGFGLRGSWSPGPPQRAKEPRPRGSG